MLSSNSQIMAAISVTILGGRKDLKLMMINSIPVKFYRILAKAGTLDFSN